VLLMAWPVQRSSSLLWPPCSPAHLHHGRPRAAAVATRAMPPSRPRATTWPPARCRPAAVVAAPDVTAGQPPPTRPGPGVGVVRVATIRDARGTAPQHWRRRTREVVGKMELGGGCGDGALGFGGERTARGWVGGDGDWEPILGFPP
jgi:hypothetical protein